MSIFNKVMRPTDGAAWVTGASSGIGRAVCLRLAAEGWTVYATARRTDRLEKLSAEASGPGRIIAAAADVTDASQLQQVVDRITSQEGLALAILNAGIYMPMRARSFDAETARDMLEVNLIGVTNALDPVLKAMIAAGTGHVALTASVAGYRGLPGAAPYSASKAALIAMAEALAMDLVDHNVRISVINPGFVETDATAVNEFEMPFLQTTDQAADHIVSGLSKPGFEIAFPWIFVRILRLIGLLPNRAYIWFVRAATGWKGT